MKRTSSLKEKLAKWTVLEVSKSTPRFGDLLWRLIRLNIQLYSWLRFITAKNIKQNQQRKKAQEVKSGGNHVQTSFKSLLVESHRTCLIPTAMNCDHKCKLLSTRKLIRDSVPKVFWLLVTLCLACAKTPDSQKESRCSK